MSLSRREEIAARLLAGLLANPLTLEPPMLIFNPGTVPSLDEMLRPGQIVPVDEPNDIRQIEANLAALAVKHTDALMVELDRTAPLVVTEPNLPTETNLLVGDTLLTISGNLLTVIMIDWPLVLLEHRAVGVEGARFLCNLEFNTSQYRIAPASAMKMYEASK